MKPQIRPKRAIGGVKDGNIRKGCAKRATRNKKDLLQTLMKQGLKKSKEEVIRLY